MLEGKVFICSGNASLPIIEEIKSGQYRGGGIAQQGGQDQMRYQEPEERVKGKAEGRVEGIAIGEARGS